MPPATRRATRGFGPPAALLVVDDDTASTPPRALHAHRKTLPRDHPDFYHGLLGKVPTKRRVWPQPLSETGGVSPVGLETAGGLGLAAAKPGQGIGCRGSEEARSARGCGHRHRRQRVLDDLVGRLRRSGPVAARLWHAPSAARGPQERGVRMGGSQPLPRARERHLARSRGRSQPGGSGSIQRGSPGRRLHDHGRVGAEEDRRRGGAHLGAAGGRRDARAFSGSPRRAARLPIGLDLASRASDLGCTPAGPRQRHDRRQWATPDG